MTASLDRAVEAACARRYESWAEYSEMTKAGTRDEMRLDILAALPHLGVDREALHNALWCKVASEDLPPWQWNRVNDRVRALEAAEATAIHLIETNQEATK